MASLLSDLDVSDCRQALIDHLDTFKRDSVIYRVPQANPMNINDQILAGYGEPSVNPNVTYTATTGVFSAIRVNKNHQPLINLSEIKAALIGEGRVKIKVEEDAKDFIETAPIERIEVDGMNFNIDGAKHVQNFLGQIYYIYALKATS